MAIADTVSGSSVALASGTAFDIQPDTGDEWMLHNIYYTAGAGMTLTFNIVDGANTIPFGTSGVGASGSFLGACFNLTNTHFLRITSSGATVSSASYDGIKSKE